MLEKHYYVSNKFALVDPLMGLVATAIPLGSAAHMFFVKRAWFFALFMVLVSAMPAFLLRTIWRITKNRLRFASIPLISFGDDRVTYRQSPQTDESVSTNYADISGLGCSVYTISGSLQASINIQRWGEPSDYIDITNLNASPEEIFAEFEQRLPSLVRPSPDEMALITERYLPKFNPEKT